MITPAPPQARSPRFRMLERELATIRRHFLPRQFNPLGVYPDRVVARTYAYRLLSHAEFEAYLEDRARELAIAAVDAWRNQNRICKAAACMLAFSEHEMDKLPKSIVPQVTNLADRLHRASIRFNAAISNNNGIKEANVLALLLPIGVEPIVFSTGWLGSNGWLTTIDTFGTARGAVAHQSASHHRTQQPPDPKDELSTVTGILRGLRDIDSVLSSLKP